MEDADDGSLGITVDGQTFSVKLQDEHDLLMESFGGGDVTAGVAQQVRAPMPGLVRAVHVQNGDEVSPGSPLLVLEAMKMENELIAEGPGIVRELSVSDGDAVEKGQALLEIVPESA